MINPMDLSGKKILFIGSDTGLDKSIINIIKELGATIVDYLRTDVKDIELNVKSIVASEGAFDGLVYGIVHSDFKPLQYVKPELVNELTYDNYGMFVEIMRSLKKHKGLRVGASVVAMSSISSIRAMKAKMAFCAAKAALDASVRCLAVELGDKGIRVNSIQKGGVDTDFEKTHIQVVNGINEGSTEKKQILGITESTEVANVVAFLLSDATKTITGTSIVIDGGYIL